MENLVIIGIIINCFASYLTSDTYKNLFVSVTNHTHLNEVSYKDTGFKFYALNWDELDFFWFVILIEHGIFVLKLVLEKFIDDVPTT